MKKWRSVVVALALVLFVVAWAFGADGSADETWIGTAWNVLWKIIALIVTVYGTVGLRALAKKFNIQLSTAQEDKMQAAALYAVEYVNELARKNLKIDKFAMSSEAKLNEAVRKMIEKVPGIDEETATEQVLAALASTRIKTAELVEKKVEEAIGGGATE